MSITGILPAAGTASRMDGLPKFLLPTNDSHLLGTHIARMRAAGAGSVWVGASKATTPFVKPFVDGNVTLKGNLETATMCETVLAARAHCGDSTVLFGMPDTHWVAPDVYDLLLHRIREFGADVAVAAWKMRNEQKGKLGAVDQRSGRLTRVVDKDAYCGLDWAWGAVAWKPVFWDFIEPEMPHVGMALQAAAADAHLSVLVVQIEGEYWDAGTKSEYFELCTRFAREAVYA